ncbi:MAG: hypothetical protein NUV69_00460 [Candidatus Curtissbacteria bacterium]|nr:hypothetical protein [Candidatus Curtissbacteria bacterium]
MASIVSGNQVKLNSGQVIQANELGWYDGQQFAQGTLSAPGQINSRSSQIGAGQQVSEEVNRQSAQAQNVPFPQFQSYLQEQQRTFQPSATPQPSGPSGPSGPGGSGTEAGFQAPETINLPQQYESLYANSGVRDIEADLNAKTLAKNEAVAKIKDNPFLSEATMTGRIAKLDAKFAQDTLALQNQIATKKADIETQLNLQVKQFDINSQAATQALNQFNTLLSAGALDNASGEAIANLTRSTGISSSMIYSAINAQREKNIQTSTISFDDGTNQGFAVINSRTGQIISRQNVASSKPKAASVSDQKNVDAQQTQQNFINDVKAGVTPRQLVPHYGGTNGLSIDEIYRLYNSYSPWGPAQESLDEFKEGKFVS